MSHALWCHMLSLLYFHDTVSSLSVDLTVFIQRSKPYLSWTICHIFSYFILFNKFYKYEELFFLAKKMNRYVNLHKYTAVLEIHLIYVYIFYCVITHDIYLIEMFLISKCYIHRHLYMCWNILLWIYESFILLYL